MIAATIKAIGLPLQEAGVFAASSLSRIVEKIYNTKVKPTGIAIEYVSISIKLYFALMLFNVTFNTTQLVVISGKYTPSALYNAGLSFLMIISTS